MHLFLIRRNVADEFHKNTLIRLIPEEPVFLN